MSDDEEPLKCLQCGWHIRRCEAVTQIIVPGDVTGPPRDEFEAMGLRVIGVVHILICAYDYVVKEPPARTQRRRTGMAGMN